MKSHTVHVMLCGAVAVDVWCDSYAVDNDDYDDDDDNLFTTARNKF
jgi:hypothetical protein